MRFLVDAQLPIRMAQWLNHAGHDTRHTLELPLGNRTPDVDVVAIAVHESRVVVTKDDDFVHLFLLNGEPRLLLISTGNISNFDLEHLVRSNLAAIERAFEQHRYVELSRTALVIHH